MNFIKMEGIGNDFIVTHEVRPEDIGKITGSIAALCDRRRGIGGDGIIFILPSLHHDFQMRIFNSDGSEAEMCGNGIRCCVKYIHSMKLKDHRNLSIETLAGTITTELLENEDVCVNMGVPRLLAADIPVAVAMERVIRYPLDINGHRFEITAVSMGNPHAVIYTDDLSDNHITTYGPIIENHPLFPRRINVEFVKVSSDTEITMRVWERGCGETLACGTGACAAAVSGIMNNLHGKKVTIHLPGGDLVVAWNGNDDDPVMMTGPATVVFKGSITSMNIY